MAVNSTFSHYTGRLKGLMWGPGTTTLNFHQHHFPKTERNSHLIRTETNVGGWKGSCTPPFTYNFIIPLKRIYFISCVWGFASIYACALCVQCPETRKGHRIPWNWSHRWLWATILVLGPAPMFSTRAESALHNWTISLTLSPLWCDFLCVFTLRKGWLWTYKQIVSLTCVSATIFSSGFRWTVKASLISLTPSESTSISTICWVSPSLNSISTNTKSLI